MAAALGSNWVFRPSAYSTSRYTSLKAQYDLDMFESAVKISTDQPRLQTVTNSEHCSPFRIVFI